MPTEEELNEALNSDDGNVPSKETPEPKDEPEEEPVEAEADSEAEPETEEEPEAEPEPKPREPTRYERRMQSLAERTARAEAEARLASETAERYRREAEAASALQRQREDELLDPSERRMRELERMTHNAHMASIDAADRSTFLSKASVDPNRGRYSDRVEAELQKARAAGQNASREGIYVYLRGQDAIAAESKNSAARQKSVDKVKSERGKPGTPKSDAQPSRVRSLEDRLKDVAI